MSPAEAMPTPGPRLIAASVAAVAAYLIAVHLLLVTDASPRLSLAVIVAPWLLAAVTSLWSADRSRASAWRRTAAVVLVVAAVGLAWLCGDALATQADRVLYLENLVFLAALAGSFALTMRPGHEALITRLARIARGGDMPPRVVRYTRAVTVGWCVFFIVAAGLSTALFALQSRAVWSSFVNLALFPLVAVAFGIEYLVRLRVLRGLPHEPFLTGVMAFRQRDRLDVRAEARSES